MQREEIIEGLVAIVIAFKGPQHDFESINKMIFLENSLSSVEFIAFLVELEKRFHIEFDEKMLFSGAYSDLHEIVDYIEIQIAS